MAGAPDPQAVALRALCLTAVAAAGAYALVLEAEPDSEDEVIAATGDLVEWIVEDGLGPALSAQERALIDLPLDEWSDAQRAAASGRAESLGVLLWALGVLDELPPWDEPFDAADEAPLGETIEELLERAEPRPADELERARDIADLWHWRATAAGRDLDVVGGTARAAYDAGDIPEPLSGDFSAFGKAYRELEPVEAELARAIAAERREALAWLTGQGGDWAL